MNSPENDISVVVCCYNSSSRLPETIKHLSQQKSSGFSWEIIVIDNLSTDATERVAKEELAKVAHISYRVIKEETPGLAAARERGVKEANYGIIVFCDDDNHLEPDYLQKANAIMASRPEVGILGGLVKPKLVYYPGKWIESMYTAMGIGARGKEDGYVSWVFGAGMVIRKRIFTEFKERNIGFILSDRTGNKQTAGGDSEWCELAKYIGYKIYYSSSLVLYHYMQEHRLKKSFFFKGYSMVYAPVYLWLLSKIVNSAATSNDELYKIFLKEKTKNIVYHLPRIIISRYQFYNFISLYQALLTFFWLLFRRKKFNEIYQTIIKNLGIKN